MSKPGWSDAEAEQRYGWTARAPGHSHLYRVAVTVSGTPDPETGTIVDLAGLDAVLDREVMAHFAGSDLNVAIDAVASGDAVPGCEVLAAAIWRRVTRALPVGVTLQRVAVAEDETLEAECTGLD